MSNQDQKQVLGVGLDVGTMNLVSARQTPEGKATTRRVRDAFIDLDAAAKKSLRLSKVNYVEKDGNLIVVGDSALNMANLFKREVRRPLSRGIISPGEHDAQEILSLLIQQVLGTPEAEGEHCYYSVPAAPIDDPDQDVVYHAEIFRKIIAEHGYTPHPSNEAQAIIYSQCADSNFSGLAISFGSGMANVALAYQTVLGMSFSVARCLADDFPVLTEHGIKPMSDITVEDKVLDANGVFVPVHAKLDNGPREELLEVTLEHLSSFPHRMTPDHRVFVQRRFGWEWVEAGSLVEGDVCGVPTIQATENLAGSYYFGRKNGHNLTAAKARNLGRFFGIFLGDGSCGPYKEDPEFVQIAIDLEDKATADKVCTVLNTLFGGTGVQRVEDVECGVCRVKLHSTVVARHMKDRFYTSGVKTCPIPIHTIPDQMALGIIEGLLDTDGHTEPKRRTVTNTSLPVVVLLHHLLNRFGLAHSIQKRGPRLGGVNKKGVQIVGRKPTYEVRLVGHAPLALLHTLLEHEQHQVYAPAATFALHRVKSIKKVPYGRHVYDLQVGSEHHSFSSVGMVVHNCGDWIDQHAAKALGSTTSRVCALKEKGVNILQPKCREEEALALYIRALIRYTLENVVSQFRKVQATLDLPEPIPFVISGGTSKAGGFMDVFKEEFEAFSKKGFPFQISEIRQAKDPMTAVAEGLLVLALQEYED